MVWGLVLNNCLCRYEVDFDTAEVRAKGKPLEGPRTAIGKSEKEKETWGQKA